MLVVSFVYCCLFVSPNNKCLFQANGFNPSPTDTSNVVLSRELQVSLLSSLIVYNIRVCVSLMHTLALSFIQGDGGGGG